MLVKKTIVQLNQPFATENGFVSPRPEVAYEQYGNPDGPVILLCHGGLSSCHAAGKYAETDPQPGWWDGLIGPGKPFDTGRYRIISMNALGSMHGSTGTTSIDPSTGCRFGPTFPRITLRDQVRFVKAFIDRMEISQVHIMAGPSMGSLHTLQMAAMYPDTINAAVSAATAGRMPASGMAMHHFIINALRSDPAFHGGWYDPQQPLLAMKLIWQVIRLYYTSDKIYKKACFDASPPEPGAQAKRAAAAGAFLTAGMDIGITMYDPNAFITVVDAINTHDLGEGFATYEEGVRRLRCPLLLLNVDTDHEFPPDCAHEIAEIINAARPGQVTEHVLQSSWGHLGCVRESEQLKLHIGEWMTAHGL